MTPAQKEHQKLVELSLKKIMEIHVLISESQDLIKRYPEMWSITGDMERMLSKLSEVTLEE